MLSGQYPTQYLLEKHNLLVFSDISKAVQKGDVRSLEIGLKTHHRLLLRKGLYLVTQRLKIVAYRNLLVITHKLMNNVKMPVPRVLSCFHAAGTSLSQAELECVLANMIFRGVVKGYISYAHKTMVVSAKEPFPALNESLYA